MDNITSVIGELSLIQRLREAIVAKDDVLFDDILKNSDIDKQLKSINKELSLNFTFRYNIYASNNLMESILRIDLLKEVDKHIFKDEITDIHKRYVYNSFRSKLYISDFSDIKDDFILHIKIINNIIYILDGENKKELVNISIFDLDDFSTEIYLNTLIDSTGLGVRVDIFIEMLKIYVLAYNQEIRINYIDFSHDIKIQIGLINILRGILE